jgi:hypothetical protein
MESVQCQYQIAELTFVAGSIPRGDRTEPDEAKAEHRAEEDRVRHDLDNGIRSAGEPPAVPGGSLFFAAAPARRRPWGRGILASANRDSFTPGLRGPS